MKLALDTNILAYAEGVNGAPEQAAALDLVQRLPPESVALPVQVLGELFALLVRKAGRSRAEARQAVLSWCDAFPLIETSASVLFSATDLAETHQFGFWDAVILSAAAEGGCRLLLSEDLQPSFTWRGVTVTNPLASPAHPLLAPYLTG